MRKETSYDYQFRADPINRGLRHCVMFSSCLIVEIKNGIAQEILCSTSLKNIIHRSMARNLHSEKKEIALIPIPQTEFPSFHQKLIFLQNDAILFRFGFRHCVMF